MKTIKLYSIYTDEESSLKDIFVKSLQDDWQLCIGYWGKLGRDDGDWGTPEYIALMRRRIEHLVDVIKKEQDEVIIWSDIDIQFFGRCQPLIERALADKDMVFLSESWPKRDVSGGFVVIRCNPKTLLFFESVLKTDFETFEFHDQTAINNILKNNPMGLSWDILPRQFWARSHGPYPPVDIVLQHANLTFPSVKDGRPVRSVTQKIEQLKRIRRYVVVHRRWGWLFSIGSKVKKYLPDRLLSFLKNVKDRCFTKGGIS